MNRFYPLLTLLFSTIILLPITTNATTDKGVKSRLVTAASTGIAGNLAQTLPRNSHHVYAGTRKEKDLIAHNAIENITAVKLDVTKQDEIDAVVALTQNCGREA